MLNGNVKGDWEGEYMYIGARGCTVIDYLIVNECMLSSIEEFRIDERVDSDHMPLCLEIRKEDRRGKEEENEEEYEGVQVKTMVKWGEDAIQKYKGKMENTEEKQKEELEQSLERQWQYLKSWVHRAMVKKEIRIKRRKLGHKD